MLAEAHGDTEAGANLYLDAANRWAGFATPVEEAYALLGAGRCLVVLGRKTEAAVSLEPCPFSLGESEGGALLAETDALLERTVSLSA